MKEEVRESCCDLKRQFMEYYQEVKDEYFESIRELYPCNMDMVEEWMCKVCDYNIQGGKMNRGISLLEAILILKNIPINDKNNGTMKSELIRMWAAMGWCIEWLQTSFLIADDIMDKSTVRRGKQCWYLNDGVGMIAINDCFALQSMIYKTIQRHFRQSTVYVPLLELFLDIKVQTELGQLTDLLTSRQPINYSQYTMENYRKIVRYKTSFYSFYLPVKAALIVTEYQMKEVGIKDILLDLGEFFQIQDDYLDCFGDPAVMGKIGTDIQEGKCTWLIVKSLELLKSDQRKDELTLIYGHSDSDKVQRVKDIYRDHVDIPAIFNDLQEKTKKSINNRINSIEDKPLRQILQSFSTKVFNRSK